jgi:hypothetical protein
MLSRRRFISMLGCTMAAAAHTAVAFVAEVPPMLDHVLLGCSDLESQYLAWTPQLYCPW